RARAARGDISHADLPGGRARRRAVLFRQPQSDRRAHSVFGLAAGGRLPHRPRPRGQAGAADLVRGKARAPPRRARLATPPAPAVVLGVLLAAALYSDRSAGALR